MGNYPTGVSVVTTTDEAGEAVGLTVNSFASVSLDPLLILWSIDHGSSSYQAFLETDRFAVNILSEEQAYLCDCFAKKRNERFKANDWEWSNEHIPLFKNTTGILECSVHERIVAGDHTIIIGRVLNIIDGKKDPLLYHQGRISGVNHKS